MSRVVRSVIWAAALGAAAVRARARVPARAARARARPLPAADRRRRCVRARPRAVARPPRAPSRAAGLGSRRLAQRLPELERTERAVLLSASNAFDVHYRLRPILREIAAQRLATRRGLSLDDDVGRRRAVVGEETWELVRGDREPPHLRFAPGVQAAELREVVAALERI